MSQTTVNFKEEFSAKIPALTLLTQLGYQFIPPSECEALRGNPFAADKKSTHQVVLMPIMSEFLTKQTFPFVAQLHKVSLYMITKVGH